MPSLVDLRTPNDGSRTHWSSHNLISRSRRMNSECLKGSSFKSPSCYKRQPSRATGWSRHSARSRPNCREPVIATRPLFVGPRSVIVARPAAQLPLLPLRCPVNHLTFKLTEVLPTPSLSTSETLQLSRSCGGMSSVHVGIRIVRLLGRMCTSTAM